MSSPEPAYLGDAFLDRVKRSYRLAVRDVPRSDGWLLARVKRRLRMMIGKSAGSGASSNVSMWNEIDTLRRPIHEALMAPDNTALRDIFANPGMTDLFYGVDNLAASLERQLTDIPQNEISTSIDASEQIVALGQALGVIRWVPRQGEPHFVQFHAGPFAAPSPGIDLIRDQIAEKLGFDIAFPAPFPGDRGAATSRGLANRRAIMAIYQAARVAQETKGNRDAAILEIGPGIGRTAFYAAASGYTNYTTIDLPIGVVAQACFLGRVLGPDAIWLLGDDEPPAGKIRMLPCIELESLQQNFDLVLNVDSLTEMSRNAASEYLAWIAGHAKIFLSINHEANELTIDELSQPTLGHFSRKRFPYWMRTGYCEEVFARPD